MGKKILFDFQNVSDPDEVVFGDVVVVFEGFNGNVVLF